jgi:hypothetical protein
MYLKPFLSKDEYQSAINEMIAKSRRTIGGYLEARLNSPFAPIDNVEPLYISPE